jgi:hypothetical protein
MKLVEQNEIINKDNPLLKESSMNPLRSRSSRITRNFQPIKMKSEEEKENSEEKIFHLNSNVDLNNSFTSKSEHGDDNNNNNNYENSRKSKRQSSHLEYKKIDRKSIQIENNNNNNNNNNHNNNNNNNHTDSSHKTK